MWYPSTVTTPPTSEPVSAADIKRQTNVFHDDDNVLLDGYAAAAREHVEKYCNARFAAQTITAKCDRFADMCRLSEAPVTSVTSIQYVDTSGTTQTLPDTVYELRADGLESSITLKFGQYWPAIQAKSRITLTAVVGYASIPKSVKHAMLLWIADAYEQRENAAAAQWTALDALLCNHRRGG